MRRTALTAALATLTLSSASAQIFVETYDNGHNEGDYEIWFATYNSIPSSGGNPGWYLRLDNTGGPLTCQFLEIFPNVWPNAFSGDYRAQGVTSVGLDANIVQGAFGVPATSIWEVWLVDDNGTPSSAGDDCLLIYTPPNAIPPQSTGWETFTFTIASQSTTLPANWRVEGPCSTGNWDAVWNTVIQDVDYLMFRMDTNPGAFCAFTAWDFGVDNMRIDGAGGPLGTNYCSPAIPNSAGQPATISAAGSPFVGSNDVTLTASELPVGQFGYFLTSQTQGLFNPPNSNGFICLGGAIGRYNQPGNVGQGPTFSIQVDLTAVPQPAGLVAVIPGDTWNFQAWYRDIANTNNFTDAVSVLFQ